MISERFMKRPELLLLFGASGHIAGPAAKKLRQTAPDVNLRLATSSAEKAERLRRDFPGCSVVVANYMDLPSLVAAFEGVSRAFVITPDFIDEKRAMTNISAAAYAVGTIEHIVRLTGDPPGIHSEAQVSKRLLDFGGGTAVQHLRARRLLESTDLPVTYINIASYYMDNFINMMADPIRMKRQLIMPYDRRMSYIDPRDVGRAVASIMLSGDRFHFGKTYHLDNGVDCLTFRDVTAIMSEEFGIPITFSGSVEYFDTECRALFDSKWGPGAIDYMIAYAEWELTSEPVWRRTDILTSLFGIETPVSLRSWLQEHKHIFVA